MESPATLTDALAALSAAQADVAALNALSAEHSALVAQFEALKARSAELSAALDLANANNRDLAAALDAVKAAEADAAAKANAIVANLGVAPVAIVPEQISAPKSKNELWAHYMTLGFSERNEFYAANKKAMQL
jgi:seryl-tRNA synthetase